MISFDPDEVALAFTAEHLGADKILWASDYPHPDAKIPGVVKELERPWRGRGTHSSRCSGVPPVGSTASDGKPGRLVRRC